MLPTQHVGLSTEQVIRQRERFGANKLTSNEPAPWILMVKSVVMEPLFLILLVTAAIYLLLGKYDDAIILIIAILLVSAISIFQETRSSRAEKALRQYIEPKIKVFRNGQIEVIEGIDLVVGDIFQLADGDMVPADSKIIEGHDLSVNESILTGESSALYKDAKSGDAALFQGTLILSGYGVAEVTAVGIHTKLGKIQQSLAGIVHEKTPIQQQIHGFVKSMVQLGLLAFLAIWVIQYYISQNLWYGLLKGLTLSMSLLPEEIPVAFSTFMALGALSLYRKQVLVKNPMTVETLGAVTTICLDKTGTITENQMSLASVYHWTEKKRYDLQKTTVKNSEVVETAMWASETDPFDPMEQSLHAYYALHHDQDERERYQMIREYPLSGKPPMMVHVYEHPNKGRVIACKGGLETIIPMCTLKEEAVQAIQEVLHFLADQGHRVLAVARAKDSAMELPEQSYQIPMEFLGLVSFIDPPKAGIDQTIKAFYHAGIDVKILSGDYPATTAAIAQQIGIRNAVHVVTGDQIMHMNERSLVSAIKEHTVFARMYPEAKYRVIEQLKKSGEVVAMTGDGVNDGPALKAANIGIAMGKRGSELARKTASLVLATDDVSKMVDGIALGRRIYENLKKAIQYIISIHIPIILIVTMPLILFWEHTDFFQPIHVIFLELIMGPTCSILFENEPIEQNAMDKPPRAQGKDLFEWDELGMSIVQGLVITTVCLSLASNYLRNGYGPDYVRSMLYTCLVFSNVFLTMVNRSFTDSVWTTLQRKNWLVPIILCISLLALFITLYVQPIQRLFRFEALFYKDMFWAIACAVAAVFWVEIYKWVKRSRIQRAIS